MKFKPGNIVKKNIKNTFDELKDDAGKLYVIEYLYNEKNCFNRYSIINMATGDNSLCDESNLKLVLEGNIELINQLKEKNDQIYENQKSLKWIKENFNSALPINSILTLFHKVGLFSKVEYKSNFEKDDEYRSLCTSWITLYPIFCAIFNEDKNQMMDAIDTIFKEDFKEKNVDKFSSLYDEVAAL